MGLRARAATVLLAVSIAAGCSKEAPAPQRPAPAELRAAAAAGELVATIAGVDAWSPAAPVRAGEVFALDDGRRLRAVRAWSPRADALEVSFQVEG